MKIAFQMNSQWDSIPHAEAELAQRMLIASESIDKLQAISSSSIDEIALFSPDVIIPLHFFLPKLFDAFTIGCMWNPTYAIDLNNAWENVLSYDGYGVGSDQQEQLIKALKFNSSLPYFLGKLYPSANRTDFKSPENFEAAVYIGSNWDSRRHKELFLTANSVRVFGPKGHWADLVDLGHAYQGEIPFDGKSVIEAYRRFGIGLAIHHPSHNDEGIPCMRPFEIAASGAIMIADENPFIAEMFGDNALYVDSTLQGEALTEQVEKHVAWILDHPKAAREMAHECNKKFNEQLSLEVLLSNLIEEYSNFHIAKTKIPLNGAPSVEIIIRTDGDQKLKLFRALQSVQNQTYPKVSARIVYRGKKNLFNGLKNEINREFHKLKIHYSEAYQLTDRGTQFYTGLRQSCADYVGFLDHDDILFKDHVESLVSILSQDPDITLAYSGSIRIWEDGAPPAEEAIRKLAFYFDLTNESELKAVIVSNSYLLKRNKIPWQILNQPIPKIESKEDYIFLELLRRNNRKFAFSRKVTCAFYWRASKNDNSAFEESSNIQGQSVRKRIFQSISTTMGYSQVKKNQVERKSGIVNKLKTLFAFFK